MKRSGEHKFNPITNLIQNKCRIFKVVILKHQVLKCNIHTCQKLLEDKHLKIEINL